MKQNNYEKSERIISLKDKFPTSEACDCSICRSYCLRPGWWSVEEASRAVISGYGKRMMLEMAPDFSFGVLSPAFRGCEGYYALQEYALGGCNFLKNDRCELHGTDLQPLECRYCHHSSKGMGEVCHRELEKDWKSIAGQELVKYWLKLINGR